MAITPAATPAALADQVATFLGANGVAFTREGDAFAFSLQGREVLASAAVGLLRLYVPLIEGVEEAEAVETITLLDRAAALPTEYADVAAYMVDVPSKTAGLNVLLPMPRTFSPAALGDACDLIVEIASALTAAS